MNSVVLQSVVDRVTVHPTSAHVVRVAELPSGGPEPGSVVRVRLLDLPLVLRSGSLRARVEGGGRLLRFDEVADLEVRVDSPPGASLEELQTQLREANQAVRRWSARVDALGHLLRGFQEELDLEADPGLPDALALSAVDDARAALLDTRARDLVAARAALRTARRAARGASLALSTAGERDRLQAQRGIEADIEWPADRPGRLVVDYFVDGVRWAPTYTLDLAHSEATLTLQAQLAQATGETWEDTALAVSTVQVKRSTALPKLDAWRVGRAQPAVSSGWRPLPTDLPELFRPVDPQRLPQQPERPSSTSTGPIRQQLDHTLDTAKGLLRLFAAPPSGPVDAAVGGVSGRDYPEEPLDDGILEGALALTAPPPPPMMPPSMAAPRPSGMPAPPAAAPMPDRSMMAGGPPPQAKKRARGRPMSPAAPASSLPAPQPPKPSELLDYGWLRLPPWTDLRRRGGLHPVSLSSALQEIIEERSLGAGSARTIAEAVRRLRHQQDQLGRAAFPPGCQDSQQAGFHHKTAYGPRTTVPADGQFRSIHILAATTRYERVFRVVPRQDTTVQAMVELDNPTGGPLGTGPLRVLEDANVRANARLSAVGRGGRIRLSIGPEERLRVARNTEVREEVRGMLGGERVILHRIEVTIANRMPRRAMVEVFEALPDDSEDAGVDVRLDPGDPPPERGHDPNRQPNPRALLWRVDIPSGEERTIRWGYTITLSSRAELTGGNRREP